MEKEIVSFPEPNPFILHEYFFVLRKGREVAMGNLFDTTNWQQLKINLLKPLLYDPFPDKCKCDGKAELKKLLKHHQ